MVVVHSVVAKCATDISKSCLLLVNNHAVCCSRGQNGRRMYKTDHKFIAQINSVQSSWTAKHYQMFEHMTVDEVIAMVGGKALRYSPLVIIVLCL